MPQMQLSVILKLVQIQVSTETYFTLWKVITHSSIHSLQSRIKINFASSYFGSKDWSKFWWLSWFSAQKILGQRLCIICFEFLRWLVKYKIFSRSLRNWKHIHVFIFNSCNYDKNDLWCLLSLEWPHLNSWA